jgi:O-antigen/teichoic acid export membrane protein
MASAIILLPLYIHHFSTEMYGALSIYLVFTLLVQIIVTFSFDASLFIHFHEFKRDPKKLAVFVSSAFVFMILSGVVVTVALSLLGGMLFKVVFTTEPIMFYPYGLASVGSGALQAIFRVHNSFLQSREKAETFFWANVLSFTLIVVCIVVGLQLYPNSLAGPVFGRLLGTVIPALWVLARVFREFGFHFDFSWLVSSFGFNTYTFIYQLQQWIINQFDRILMLFFLPLSDVGVYDFAVKCLVPVELIMNSLHTTIYPKAVSTIMSQDVKGSTLGVNRYYHGLTAVVMLVVCGSILGFPWAVEVFVEKLDYHQAIEYVPYLACIYFFRVMRLFFSLPYGTLKYPKPLPLIYFFVSALKIGLIVLLMDQFSVYGIIIASIISATVEIALLRSFIRDLFVFKFNAFKILFAPLILLGLIVGLEPFFGATHPYLLHSFFLACCAALLWWAYRNELRLIYPFSTKAP